MHASHGARSVKYRQVADEVWALEGGTRAVLTVLLLRGPQTPGELRARAERIHAFATVDEVHEVLQELADRPEPLVARRPTAPARRSTPGPTSSAAQVGAPDGSAAAPAPEPAAPAAVPAEVAPLAAFVGTWRGGGDGAYPTIEPFGYTEEIELRPVPGKPLLAYRSSTRAAADGRALHGESGFVRSSATASWSWWWRRAVGWSSSPRASSTTTKWCSPPPAWSARRTAKRVDATERRYRVQGDTLTYELAMAAVGQPLLPHLKATLHRA